MPKITTKIELTFDDLVQLIKEKYNLVNVSVSVIIEHWEKDNSIKNFEIKAEGEIKSEN